ncbi:ABC-F family ATP-binding cassette domain-containing protein [Candidatus Poriferisocius sp.]|uniref:ABC-F family ATP-binding cassette domain-containing protein n=1 Tax=Candidatus Poriferisocius sp. TaxID=3101276 RepID=UPI003B0285A8
MTALTASGLAKSYGQRRLFADASVQLSPGLRVALVGGNGTGKTTLLELLIGMDDPDQGVVVRPKGAEIGYLPQELGDSPDGTVIEQVISGAGALARLGEQLADLEKRLGGLDEDHDAVLAEFGETQANFEQLGGYALEAEAAKVLAGLGFSPADSHRPVREMSGGWRMRVALARLMVSQPDVLILDEPTNHLDVDSTAWLEQRLATWPGALLFVSHDRDFIDAVANRVVELAEGTTLTYAGGFAEFVVAREERLARIEAAAARQAREVARVERFVERFRYKATKARQVQSRVKTLEKLNRIAAPSRADLAARFAFPEPPRSSRVVAELTDATVGYSLDAQPVVSGATLAVERGQTVALVGPNGAGKTTLLRLILGDLEPDQGLSRLGANVKVAAFHQHQADELDGSKRAIEVFAAGIDPGRRNLRTVLGAFGFPGDAADRRVSELSGGERTRLALARTMIEPVNLIVLDEPTNHLDLPSCDVLEDALSAYPGTVLLVTHDRHLIRSVADALIEVRNGRAVWHHGVDEAVLTPSPPELPALAAASPADNGPEPRPGNARSQRRRANAQQRQSTSKQQKQLARLERDYEAARAEADDLLRRLSDPEIYDRPEEVHALATAHEAAAQRAAALLTRWETAVDALE